MNRSINNKGNNSTLKYIIFAIILLSLLSLSIVAIINYNNYNAIMQNNNNIIQPDIQQTQPIQPVQPTQQTSAVEPFENKGGRDIDNKKGEIILYYATWCGYSRNFLPEWEKFEIYAKNNLPNCRVRSIRCESDNEALCFQKGIEGYPTVVLYPTNGTEIKFDKERTSDKLVEFVKEHLG